MIGPLIFKGHGSDQRGRMNSPVYHYASPHPQVNATYSPGVIVTAPQPQQPQQIVRNNVVFGLLVFFGVGWLASAIVWSIVGLVHSTFGAFFWKFYFLDVLRGLTLGAFYFVLAFQKE